LDFEHYKKLQDLQNLETIASLKKLISRHLGF